RAVLASGAWHRAAGSRSSAAAIDRSARASVDRAVEVVVDDAVAIAIDRVHDPVAVELVVAGAVRLAVAVDVDSQAIADAVVVEVDLGPHTIDHHRRSERVVNLVAVGVDRVRSGATGRSRSRPGVSAWPARGARQGQG